MGSVMDNCRDEPDMVPAYELATARAENERLRAQVARLTNFTDADVVEVAFAVRAARFGRSSSAKVDRSIPPTANEMADVRACLAAYVSREAE